MVIVRLSAPVDPGAWLGPGWLLTTGRAGEKKLAVAIETAGVGLSVLGRVSVPGASLAFRGLRGDDGRLLAPRRPKRAPLHLSGCGALLGFS